MSICFISNKDLTVVYSDIARRLQREGEEIVWLAPSRRWANWLRDEGWPSADILCLAEHEAEWQDLPIERHYMFNVARAGTLRLDGFLGVDGWEDHGDLRACPGAARPFRKREHRV